MCATVCCSRHFRTFNTSPTWTNVIATTPHITNTNARQACSPVVKALKAPFLHAASMQQTSHSKKQTKNRADTGPTEAALATPWVVPESSLISPHQIKGCWGAMFDQQQARLQTRLQWRVSLMAALSLSCDRIVHRVQTNCASALRCAAGCRERPQARVPAVVVVGCSITS